MQNIILIKVVPGKKKEHIEISIKLRKKERKEERKKERKRERKKERNVIHILGIYPPIPIALWQSANTQPVNRVNR